jgi:ATP-binding cassette subfamily F protein uup
VLLVTHDRYFLDKVATQILAFEGDGRVIRYPGNFESYRTLKAQAQAQQAARPQAPKPTEAPQPPRPEKKRTKLSYKDQRELEAIEASVEAAEARKADLEALLNDPLTFQRPAGDLHDLNAELQRAGAEVDRLYQRWQELQSLADALGN